MIFWLDAQLPPSLASWLESTFLVNAKPLREIGLRDAPDHEIFHAARTANAVIITKDSDFLDLSQRLGAPPQILWLTCGNMTNFRLKTVFSTTFPSALKLLESGETIVEIGDEASPS